MLRSLQRCTQPGQIDCVQCQGSAGSICTPTEAAFVQVDITRNVATSAGPDPAAGCYSCLVAGGCLDDTGDDVGHECGDLSATFDADAQSGTSDSTLCVNTVSCITTSGAGGGASPGCAASASGLTNCYCGSNGGGPSSCAANVRASNPANGACAQTIADGLGFPLNDGSHNMTYFTDATKPAGMADKIFVCARANSCATQCF